MRVIFDKTETKIFFLVKIKHFLFGHKHVNILVRVEHVSGALLANDRTELLRVELRVEHRAREIPQVRRVLGRALGIGQEIAKVRVELRIVWQIVEDQMVYASYLVSLDLRKS
jgi:hypothetical protein